MLGVGLWVLLVALCSIKWLKLWITCWSLATLLDRSGRKLHTGLEFLGIGILAPLMLVCTTGLRWLLILLLYLSFSSGVFGDSVILYFLKMSDLALIAFAS